MNQARLYIALIFVSLAQFISGCEDNGIHSTPKIITVNGEIAPDKMGIALTHEHVLVDFIGADKVSPDRYDADQAFDHILPHLKKLKELGCDTFFECTPEYLGRDVLLLKRLSKASGLNIITNTGYYGAVYDRFLPPHAFTESADELAARWISEFENGIKGTAIRPGFIKIGVDKETLSEIDRKLVQAAARAHLKTGLTIMSHTGPSLPAHEQIALLKKEGVHPSAWIWTHAQHERDNNQHIKAAKEGAWIAFDGINSKPEKLKRDIKSLLTMKEAGLLNRVLLSHDAGWYRVGEENGGKFRPYNDLFKTFIPELKKNAFTDEEVELLAILNPQEAFLVRRKLN